MLNRLLSPFRPPDTRAGRWEIDRNPRLRLATLFGLLLLSFGAISARLTHVQLYLGDEFAAAFSRTTELREPIPSRDGRLLSSDGQVLAEDLELFALMVHYRWLEEPSNPAWLRQQANSKLDRASRRRPDRIAVEEASVLRRRAELWRQLARLTGLTTAQLDRERKSIQNRVKRVYSLVEQRREGRQSFEGSDSGQSAETPGWRGIWNLVVAALTTSPRRDVDEPLIIREQLDYHQILAEIPVAVAIEIEAHPERYPGTRIETCTQRVYPQGATAAHVVGYRGPLDDDTIRTRRQKLPKGDPLDYQIGDRQGRAGLERFYERHLRGIRGERKLCFNRRGELVESAVVREPRFGHDLIVTLNLPLQSAAEQLLDDQLARPHVDETTGKPLPLPPGGAIVALDVRTGAVLAAASAPRFDPMVITGHDEGAWRDTRADARNPLFHRAVEMALPPGSIFKVVSAVAFLESGQLDPEQTFACQGFLDEPDRYRCFTFRNFGVGHGDVNLVAALARSCNVYFFSAARRIGPEPLQEWTARFGFGQPSGIDLPGEGSGNLPAIGAPDRVGSQTRKRNPASGDTLQFAIGQSKLTATPLQVVRMMAVIANGGRLVTPYLAESSAPAIGSRPVGNRPGVPTADRRIPELSPRTLQWLRMGLRETVAHPQGTGFKTVRLKDVEIAGKTGTAETGGGRPDHAWFAGYFPADRPTIAFVVVLEHAGPGGHAAGPVAREFVQAAQALGLIDGAHFDAPSAN